MANLVAARVGIQLVIVNYQVKFMTKESALKTIIILYIFFFFFHSLSFLYVLHKVI